MSQRFIFPGQICISKRQQATTLNLILTSQYRSIPIIMQVSGKEDLFSGIIHLLIWHRLIMAKQSRCWMKKLRKIRKMPHCLIDRAEIMEQNGNIQGALNEFENYLKLWPLNYSILKKTGQIYSSMKQLAGGNQCIYSNY